MINTKVIILLVGGAGLALGGCVVSKYIENADPEDVKTVNNILKKSSIFIEAVSEFIEANRCEEIEE